MRDKRADESSIEEIASTIARLERDGLSIMDEQEKGCVSEKTKESAPEYVDETVSSGEGYVAIMADFSVIGFPRMRERWPMTTL